MKSYEIIPNNTYTCISCGEEFNSKEDLIIDKITNPICSSKCEFRWFFHALKDLGLNKENGLFLMKMIKKWKKPKQGQEVKNGQKRDDENWAKKAKEGQKQGQECQKMGKNGQKVTKNDDFIKNEEIFKTKKDEKIGFFSENDLYFETTKYCIKSLLSNVKSLIRLKKIQGQGTETKKEGQEVGNKIGTKTGTTPPLRGVCPLSLSQSNETNNFLLTQNNTPKIKRELEKWF